MKFHFVYFNKNSPSFIFYYKILNYLTKKIFNKKITYSSLEIFNKKKIFYDYVFFMSGDNKIYKIYDNSKFILVDPRANHYNNIDIFDGFIFNGIEKKLFFNVNTQSIIIPVYPLIKKKKKINSIKKKIITYHGNSEHLINFFDRFLKIEKILSKKYKISYNFIYNKKFFTKVKKLYNPKLFKSKINHVNFSIKNLSKYLSQTDIGIVPQLNSWKEFNNKKSFFQKIVNTKFFKKKYNYFLSFKETTNIGRHLVFAQCKVPIISDITLSSVNLIENGFNGFLAYKPEDWSNNIQYLIDNDIVRKKIGINLFKQWKDKYFFSNFLLDFRKFLLNLKD